MTERRGFFHASLGAIVLILALFLGVGISERGFFPPATVRAAAPPAGENWEPAIRQFEQSDKTNPPKPGGIVFTGSSSIVRWNTLASDMKPLEVVNRGFGGAELSDVNQFAKRIVVAYAPRAAVLYAGDNDLAAGSSKTPQSVANDFKEFVRIVHADLPNTWIYVLSIKPSKLRWNEWPKMQAANRLIQDFAKTQNRVQYIDVASAMFDSQGGLPADLFVADGLHPTPKCYALWTSIIRPVLLKRFGPASTTSRSALPWTPMPSDFRADGVAAGE